MPLANDAQVPVDAVIVGAGFSGLYQLYLLRRQGFTTRVFERGSDVGGTWYWNRYPGARCDVESMQYSYSFDEALQEEWHWPEKYAAQPDILAYINHVADRYDLRRHIDFSTVVTAAHFDETAQLWSVFTGEGRCQLARFVIMATGCLSSPQMPVIEGLSDYQGRVFHTGTWPHERVAFGGEHIAVIGTGSSGIQAIPVLAGEAARLTVFQRTPHYSVPARNRPMTDDYEREWKRNYRTRRHEMRHSHSGSLRNEKANDLPALSVSEAERRAIYDERWEIGGMGILKSFSDLLTDHGANRTAADFARERIRTIVKDAKTADLLSPKDYPIGTKRLCLDTGYYETFNRPNVELVDIARYPIECIMPAGPVSGGRTFAVDSIIFATGFDAMTGTLFKMDIRGRRRLSLAEKWCAGPRNYLGLMAEGFPNLFTITGPGSPSVKGNMMTSIEQHVEYVTEILTYMRERSFALIEACRDAEDAWVDRVQEEAARTLFPAANSWYMGANIPGKPRLFMPFIGGVGTYRKICEAIAAEHYRGFRFEPLRAGAPC